MIRILQVKTSQNFFLTLKNLLAVKLLEKLLPTLISIPMLKISAPNATIPMWAKANVHSPASSAYAKSASVLAGMTLKTTCALIWRHFDSSIFV